MCNLYGLVTSQAEIRASFGVSADRTGNLPMMPEIFPDQRAPIVRADADGQRILEMFRWGIPGPKQFGAHPVTNVRNVKSPHWRPWTGVRGTKAENPDRAEDAHRLFSFLTCEANGVVGPIPPKAMPVLLTTPEE